MNKDGVCLNTKCRECPFDEAFFICMFASKFKEDVEFSKIIDYLSKEIEDVKRKMKDE